MKVLHIIRSKSDSPARKVIDAVRNTGAAEQTLLLLQDAVYLNSWEFRVFACFDDVHARGVETDIPLVDYDEIVEMIFDHDKVITW